MSCKQCGSCAINHHCHGRDGSDEDLCDVCYWRARVEARLVPTSAEYAMGYAEGFNDACKPVDGWAMVPRLPTPEMITAGRNAPMCATAAHNIIEDYVTLYEAMLAASPSNTQQVRLIAALGVRAPLPREWVGLTDDEVKHEWEVWRASLPRYVGFAKGIEAKLKEKNA